MADQMIWISKVTPYWRRKSADHRTGLSSVEASELDALRELAAQWRASDKPDLRISIQLHVAGQIEPMTAPTKSDDLPPMTDLAEYLNQVDDAIASRDVRLSPNTGHFHLMKIICTCFGDSEFSIKELYEQGSEIMRALHPRSKTIPEYMRYLLQQLRDRDSHMVVSTRYGVWRRNFTPDGASLRT